MRTQWEIKGRQKSNTIFFERLYTCIVHSSDHLHIRSTISKPQSVTRQTKVKTRETRIIQYFRIQRFKMHKIKPLIYIIIEEISYIIVIVLTFFNTDIFINHVMVGHRYELFIIYVILQDPLRQLNDTTSPV